jgi:hypothetical protein
MLTTALLLALAAPVQDRVPEITLGTRTGAITEPFSDALTMAEMSDGRVIVADRVEMAFSLTDFRSGSRRTIGRNGSGPNEYLFPIGPIRWLGDTLLGGDTRNQRLLKIMPDGSINGAIPLAAMRSEGLSSWSAPKVADASGLLYWDAAIIERQPAIKRSMKARLVRWRPGSEPEIVLEFADHAEFEHRFRYRPMPQTDAWVVAPDGRIGILSAAEYRLRWYRNGAVVEMGPPIPHTPVRLTRAERDAFRARKALEPANGAGVNGAAPSPRRTQDPAQVLRAWPDSIFPDVMPPFEANGALLAGNGDIWVKRTGPASAPAARVDILDGHGKLKAQLRLPPRARLFGLGSRHVYLLAVDGDGLQTLERYDYPVR